MMNMINSSLIEDIINGMYDWVRVLDRNDNIVYINKAMAEGLNSYPIGKKCYQAIGRSAPCENCVSRKSVFNGQPHEKEENINGRVFSVMSSPVRNKSGEIIYVVEVLRDVTQLKMLQGRISEQNKKLQDDLNLAKKLQCSLLPKEIPEDKVDFSFIYKPCETLGGDFLDIFKIDEEHVGIYIADVSGHGVSASMLTIFLRSSINKKMLSPSQVLRDLYSEFNKYNFGQNLYITVFYAVINVVNKTIMFSNAGHNVPGIIFNYDRFELMRTPGIPISDWLDEPGYQDRSMQLKEGDKIFFYTDGIIEIRNKNKEEFGEERLLDILLNSNSEPSSILNSIIESVCEFTGKSNPCDIADDVTMALLRIK
ncbi:MAG: SpoIIE family protein phosphatase [Acetivibrionales bacterium]|jgi:sigma-B regulation protein RsbU (phosphoserine phosphatase)